LGWTMLFAWYIGWQLDTYSIDTMKNTHNIYAKNCFRYRHEYGQLQMSKYECGYGYLSTHLTPYPHDIYLFILLYYNICMSILKNTTLLNYYTFLIKMFIYNIMQTQYEYVNRYMNFGIRLVIIFFIISMTQH
jgi:hypothetical protein